MIIMNKHKNDNVYINNKYAMPCRKRFQIMFILIELLNDFTGKINGGGFDELSNAMVECGIVS